MAACDTELSSFPLLSGCPSDAEYFLVGNAVGGRGVGLYGRRLWSDIRQCALSGLKFVFEQFTVGVGTPPINAGQTTIIINTPNIIPGSVFITNAGPELPQNDNTQMSYTVTISPSNAIIVFVQAVQNSQQYVLHYAYIQ